MLRRRGAPTATGSWRTSDDRFRQPPPSHATREPVPSGSLLSVHRPRGEGLFPSCTVMDVLCAQRPAAAERGVSFSAMADAARPFLTVS